MRHLVYISGSSCVGKTTLVQLLLKKHPEFHRIDGDQYWIQSTATNFWERVEEANRRIVRAVEAQEASLFLDWVPCDGPFRLCLERTCVSQKRKMLQICLIGDIATLQRRKLHRDGSGIADAVQDVHGVAGRDDCLIIDTNDLSPIDVLGIADDFLRNRLL